MLTAAVADDLPVTLKISSSLPRPLLTLADRPVSGGNVAVSSPSVAAWLERQLLSLANSPYRPITDVQSLNEHKSAYRS
ncbi:MAG: hypothetical protein KKH74_01365 [Gammaproteobacteria bacterium]|nr:hypothetical protein [Gammaproteobacteria bacterium]MBU1733502.1 hypothetical protein [Gammaproteobacteria bacterium]MBU1891919.1 hypothetical protein [Gammaproteobacteria bacterium]